jgi:hypothetical protein
MVAAFVSKHIREMPFVMLVGFVLAIQHFMGIDSYDLNAFGVRSVTSSAALEAARVDFTTTTILGTVFAFGVAITLLLAHERRTIRFLAPLALVTFCILSITPTTFLPPLELAELNLLPSVDRDRAYVVSGIYWGVVYSALVCSPSAMSNMREAIDRADVRALVEVQTRLRAILGLLAGWMICDVTQVGCTHRLLLSLLDGEQKSQMLMIASSSVKYYGATDSTIMGAFVVPIEMRLRSRVQHVARLWNSEDPEKWIGAQGLNQTNYALFLKGAALLSPFISSTLQ